MQLIQNGRGIETLCAQIETLCGLAASGEIS
jgi:hypothetical protein